MAFCDHCGDITKALTLWPKEVHDECDCLCHRWKSKKGRAFLAEEKKNSRKRKKK